MRVSKISVSKGITVNVGNFESVRFDAGVEVSLDQQPDARTGNNPTSINVVEVYEHAYGIVDNQLNKQLKEIQDAITEKSIFKVDTSETKVSRRRK